MCKESAQVIAFTVNHGSLKKRKDLVRNRIQNSWDELFSKYCICKLCISKASIKHNTTAKWQ